MFLDQVEPLRRALANLDKPGFDALVPRLELACYRRGDTVVAAGTSSPLLYIVCSGGVRRHCLTAEGKPLAFDYFAVGGIFGAPAGHCVEATGRTDRAWLVDAHERLRALGKTTCKRGAPICAACPLDATCAHAAAGSL